MAAPREAIVSRSFLRCRFHSLTEPVRVFLFVCMFFCCCCCCCFRFSPSKNRKTTTRPRTLVAAAHQEALLHGFQHGDALVFAEEEELAAFAGHIPHLRAKRARREENKERLPPFCL